MARNSEWLAQSFRIKVNKDFLGCTDVECICGGHADSHTTGTHVDESYLLRLTPLQAHTDADLSLSRERHAVMLTAFIGHEAFPLNGPFYMV